MAEALAAVGIVANIIQLVDFGTRLLSRLEEYQSTLAEIPETFRHIKAELPVLLDALRQTKAAIDAGLLQDESKKALLPAIEGCGVQIKALKEVIEKVLPASGDSWARRHGKALRSLRYDAKMEKITTVIRGYIQTLTYHAAASSTSSTGNTQPPPVPSSTVPFRRDPHFVDRQILAEIFRKSQQPASRVALVGLGGVGKSQLAVEYSYRVREKSPNTWVFWVHGSSTARFTEGFRTIAERAKISGWDKPDVDILKLVHSWLCDEANGTWLIIVDNADDINIFPRQSDKPGGAKDGVSGGKSTVLLDSLPQSHNGSFLITSRSREAAFRLTSNYADIIKVNPMDQSNALTLLQNKLDGSVEQDDAMALVEALDYMPLAISQAAAYISQRAPRATVSKYLNDIRKGDQDRARLLDLDIGDSRRDGTASNSIMAAWQISFEHIRAATPSATRLLSLMSLFDRQGIPENLLCGHYQNSDDTNSDFEDDINTLLSFSLVAVGVDGDQFEMHRLVQFSTMKWLELNKELEQWKEVYVALMNDTFPLGRYENWPVCQSLFPHAQAVVQCRPADRRALETWALVLHKAAWYADDIGQYEIAENMNRSALEARKVALGEEHLDTLVSMNNLGIVLERQGKYEEAEAMHQRALVVREKVFGPEHSYVLSSLNNLGLVLARQGKYEEAQAVHQRALVGLKKELGPEHSHVLTSMNNLGIVLLGQGKYKEAEAMCRQVLAVEEKVFGPGHLETFTSTQNLGLALSRQGKYKEAEAIYRQVLVRREEVLGPEHPDTLSNMSVLASTCWYQKRWDEAEDLEVRVLETRKRVLGHEHPDTLTCMHNLAFTLQTKGRTEDAISLMEACFHLRERVLGRHHADTENSATALNEWRMESMKMDS